MGRIRFLHFRIESTQHPESGAKVLKHEGYGESRATGHIATYIP